MPINNNLNLIISPINNLNSVISSNYNEIYFRYSFHSDAWEDKGDYWFNSNKQCEIEWRAIKKFRLMTSNFGAALGKNSFFTALEIGMDITDVKPKHITGQHKISKRHCIITKPIARDWYRIRRKTNINVLGLAVPKWELRIGASGYGDIENTNGIILIKCPREMYKPLRIHMNRINSGWNAPRFYHSHIWDSHYAQIQGNLKILGKDWCDYIVYATCSDLVYVERIQFNQQYWDNELWPGLKFFFDNIFEPLIADGINSSIIKTI